MDKSSRSLVKTVTWRITWSAATFLIAWLISGNLLIAGPIAAAQLVMNTVLYYIHERIWTRIKWGQIEK
jgi:uncharacterized membrane protein